LFFISNQISEILSVFPNVKQQATNSIAKIFLSENQRCGASAFICVPIFQILNRKVAKFAKGQMTFFSPFPRFNYFEIEVPNSSSTKISVAEHQRLSAFYFFKF